MFLLENVKQLRGHDKGRTLNTILDILQGKDASIPEGLNLKTDTLKALGTKLNYHVYSKVLKAVISVCLRTESEFIW